MAMVQTKRLAALLLALLLTLFLLPSALADSGVVSGTTVSGTVRVYLSSISSLTAVDVSIAGSYSVGGDTSRALSRGQNIRVSNSGGTLMMTANGQTQTMGSRFKLRRHQTSGENGVRIAQEGADWIEDEAARADVQRWIDESGEPYDQWKANGRGVDLNRNFDARWDEQTEERATAGPDYAFYRGENPESEPETQALVELTNDFGPDSTISYHSRGEYVYWYFGQTGEALDRDETLALRIRDLTGYACLTRENADVDSFAGYKDWCVEKLGIPAFTIENGANEWGVPVPIEHFDEIYRCSRDITALVAWELNR